PHLIVSEEELIVAFQMLQPNVHVISPVTVGHNIKLIYELSKPAVRATLKVSKACISYSCLTNVLSGPPGALHVMLDGWTAPNSLSIVGLVIQYVKDHELKTFLLDMIPCVLFLLLPQ
ncbi:hypothetical protein GGX14DRAFT_350644, partial [Mycena pura]